GDGIIDVSSPATRVYVDLGASVDSVDQFLPPDGYVSFKARVNLCNHGQQCPSASEGLWQYVSGYAKVSAAGVQGNCGWLEFDSEKGDHPFKRSAQLYLRTSQPELISARPSPFSGDVDDISVSEAGERAVSAVALISQIQNIADAIS